MVIKPKRSIGGYLVVQISLTGLGIDAEGNQEPLLHIGWWANAIDFDAVQMGFPLESGTCDALTLDAERLFRWTHTAFENEWCYSVRLIDINSPMDVLIHIINPVQALLLDDDASTALSGTAAVRYGVTRQYGMGFDHEGEWVRVEFMCGGMQLAIAHWEAVRAYMEYEVHDLKSIQDPMDLQGPDDPPHEGMHTFRNAHTRLYRRMREKEVGWVYAFFWYLYHVMTDPGGAMGKAQRSTDSSGSTCQGTQ